MRGGRDTAPQPALVRGVGRWALVALIFNTVLGAGILGLPSKAYAAAGVYSLLGLGIALVLMAGVALCLAELSSRYDSTGGPYIYVNEAYGERPAFLTGWLIYASRLLTAATHLSLLLTYGAAIFPALELPMWRNIAILLLIAIMTWLMLRGARQSAAANGFFGALKVAGLAAIALVALGAVDFQTFPVFGSIGSHSLSQVVLLFIFALMGFESATIVAGEIQNPQRNLPFAILLGLTGAALIYAFLMVASIALLPNLAGTDRPIADLAGVLFGRAGELVTAGGAVLMLLGSLVAGFFLTPRMLFALGDTRFLPPPVSAVHSEWRTPHISILATSTVILVFVTFGDFITILSMATSARLLVYAACCAALLKLRRRPKGSVARFTVPGGALIPILSGAVSALVLVHGAWKELPALALIAGLGLLLTLRPRLR